MKWMNVVENFQYGRQVLLHNSLGSILTTSSALLLFTVTIWLDPCRLSSSCQGYTEDMMLLQHSHGKFSNGLLFVQRCGWQMPSFNSVRSYMYLHTTFGYKWALLMRFIEIRSRKRMSVHKLHYQRTRQASPNQRSWSEDTVSVVFSTFEESTKRPYNHRARSDFVFINSIYIL